MTDNRKGYRSTYEALRDDPDFQELSPLAQAIFHTIKLSLGVYGINVFYPSTLREYHRRASEAEIAAAIEELEAPKPSGALGWILHSRHVWWLRNGLRHEPALSLENRNHRIGAFRHAASLPERKIAAQFVDYYSLDSDAPPMAFESHPKPIPNQGEGEGKGEGDKKEKDTSPPPVAKIGVFLHDRSQAAVAAALERPHDRLALSRILEAAPDPEIWLDEVAASLSGSDGHEVIEPRRLGDCLRSFVGNGGVRKKGMSFSLFQGYLKRANDPPPVKRHHRNGRTPDEAHEPRAPIKPDDNISWTR